MTVSELIKAAGLCAFHLADPERQIGGAYAGDLLSWVMGRASQDQAWLTIMTNANTVAVASLLDLSCILLCDGCEPEAALTEAAQKRNVNVLGSSQPVFETCVTLGRLL